MSTILVCVSGAHQSGTNLGQAMTSPDGAVWTQNNGLPLFLTGANNGWSAICYAPALQKFCAVATGGSNNNNNTAVSSDGIHWAGGIGGSAGTQTLNDICWSPKLGLFCAVASTGTTAQQIITSPDGQNWTARTSPEANTWKGICWSPALSLFVAVADTGIHQVMTSPDGITWTAQTHSLAGCITVAWDATLALFCATGPTGSVQTSSNGTVWSSTTAISAINNGTIWRIASKKDTGTFAVAEHLGHVGRSTNGTAWSDAASVNGSGDNTGIDWSPALGLWIAAAGGAGLSTSPDLITWTSRTVNLGEAWGALADNYPPVNPRNYGLIVGA